MTVHQGRTTPRTPTGGINTLQDALFANPEANMREHNDVLRIVDRIREKYPTLDVAYLDPDGPASIADAPYAIYENCRDGVPRLLFSVWSLDESVFTRIAAADTQYVDVEKAIENANAAAKKAQEDRKDEVFGEAKDVVSHILASPKGRYSFPNAGGETVELVDDVGIVKRDGRSEHK